MSIILNGHSYTSASARLDAHLSKPMSEKRTDHWFHMMMALLIDEALKGKAVFVPAFRGKPDYLSIGIDGQPYAEEMALDFSFNGGKVYAFYMDAEAAKCTAEMCRQASVDKNVYPENMHEFSPADEFLYGHQRPQFTAKAVTCDLESILEKANGNILGINMGLPSQIVLPPDVTHTAWMLLLNRKGAKLANENYNEWIQLVNNCLASDEAKEPETGEMSVQDMQMMINFNAQKASGSKVIYQLMPPQ